MDDEATAEGTNEGEGAGDQIADDGGDARGAVGGSLRQEDEETCGEDTHRNEVERFKERGQFVEAQEEHGRLQHSPHERKNDKPEIRPFHAP